MFFEASCFRCRKTIFDATKVTCNMYSCAISGMSIEIMKMTTEVEPNVKTEKRGTKLALWKLFKSLKDKIVNSCLPQS